MLSKNKNQNSTNSLVLRIVEHMSFIKLTAKYSANSYTYSNIIINKILLNQKCSALSKYKDLKLYNKEKEFFHRFYTKRELFLRLKKVCEFYEKYSKIFPNYICLYESKFIYKNIRRKQKMIDAVNQKKYENRKGDKVDKDNKYFDNEIFKGDVFTNEVNKEIEKENIIINQNYQNQNVDDTLFTQNSNSLYIKDDICNQNKESYHKNKKKELEIKSNIFMDSFITNNESNRSLYSIMDVLNGNKIYVNDLKLILNDENENANNIQNINNNIERISKKYRRYDDIKQIDIRGNSNNVNDNQKRNSIKNTQSNIEKSKLKNNQMEENINKAKKEFKKSNTNQFPIISEMKKNKKTIKNKKIVYNNNLKSENYTKNKIQNNNINNNKKVISPKSKNQAKFSKEKLLINFNTNDNNHLNTLSGKENTSFNYYLSTRASQNKKQIEQKNEKTKAKIKTEDKNTLKKENGIIFKRKMANSQLANIKKYVRYKHMSQDLCNYCNTNDSKESVEKTFKLNTCNSLINNLSKNNNSKLKKGCMSSRSSMGTNSRIKSNKNISNIKKFQRPHIINNNIIIQNNNNYNYFMTENNNPNLITGTNRNNYDNDDCDSEREKLIEYLRDMIESQKSARCHRSINSQEKMDKEITEFNPISNIITEENEIKKMNTNNSQKISIKNATYYRDLITKQKTERRFRKNCKYYFNSINTISNNSIKSNNYPIKKNNIIKRMNLYKRNNSNYKERIINSIGSFSKIKNYYSNCSIKTEDYKSPSRNLLSTNTITSINCYSHYDKKAKRTNSKNNKNKNDLMIKTKTLKYFTNKFLHESDIISTDSPKNILIQRIKKDSKHKDLVMSLTKKESKKGNKRLKKGDTRNLTISCFKSESNEGRSNVNNNRNGINKIECYMSKRQNTDVKFKNNWVKNKFASCDFNSVKTEQVNFNKGLLDRINSIKHKISEGIYRNSLLKTINTQKAYLNEMKNKKNNYKSKKIYENKIIYGDNKENISPQFLIKVNKSKNFGNIKSQLCINTDIGYNGIFSK